MKTPFQQIREKCEQILPHSLLSYLPKKWEKIGDVLLLKLPAELTSHQSGIAETYATILSCKSVLKESGQVDGLFRVPDVELIWGNKDTETTHYENGIRFRLDPIKIMFSSGNIDERIRMATISNNSEIVVDMFAGIGYFSIPLAVQSRPKRVFSCEINPDAYAYLERNIVLNHVTDIIEPIMGDNQIVAPKGVADRVIMGYFGETKSYLHTAISCLKKKGGIIHYHDVFQDEKVPEKVMKDVARELYSECSDMTLEHVKRVKSIAPGNAHYVFDLRVEP